MGALIPADGQKLPAGHTCGEDAWPGQMLPMGQVGPGAVMPALGQYTPREQPVGELMPAVGQ